jgi:hypothetical protein
MVRECWDLGQKRKCKEKSEKEFGGGCELPQVLGRRGTSQKLRGCLRDTIAVCFEPNNLILKGL